MNFNIYLSSDRLLDIRNRDDYWYPILMEDDLIRKYTIWIYIKETFNNNLINHIEVFYENLSDLALWRLKFNI